MCRTVGLSVERNLKVLWGKKKNPYEVQMKGLLRKTQGEEMSCVTFPLPFFNLMPKLTPPGWWRGWCSFFSVKWSEFCGHFSYRTLNMAKMSKKNPWEIPGNTSTNHGLCESKGDYSHSLTSKAENGPLSSQPLMDSDFLSLSWM